MTVDSPLQEEILDAANHTLKRPVTGECRGNDFFKHGKMVPGAIHQQQINHEGKGISQYRCLDLRINTTTIKRATKGTMSRLPAMRYNHYSNLKCLLCLLQKKDVKSGESVPVHRWSAGNLLTGIRPTKSPRKPDLKSMRI